jgi:TRAP-type mannitol/chloroaromatic compound transport system permease small subunit
LNRSTGLLARTATACDLVNEVVGRLARWLALFLVLAQFSLVVLRYVFASTYIVMLESVVYAHAALFVFGAGYTLLHEGHVRVDIFYSQASERTKALINLFGVMFLLIPACLFIIVFSWGYVARSWSILEGPLLPGGIRGVFLLKTLIPLFGALFLIQGISMALKSIIVLSGGTPPAPPFATASAEKGP